MNYELRALGQDGAEKVLSECDEYERRRLIRYKYFRRPELKHWAVNKEGDSYFLQTLVRGDPREGGASYLFRFEGVTYVFDTNRKTPLPISLTNFGLKKHVVESFKENLAAAFSVYGRNGYGVDSNELFDLEFIGGEKNVH